LLQSYQPLYLKYRPQALGELVGQHSVSQTLTNAIDHERIAHAYLFTGPRGCGKTSSARILAKSLNCEQGPTAKPCLQCTSCIEVKECRSPAVFEIDAASNNSVDDARLLIERAPLVAQSGRFKIYIIDECHMLTKEAFNALLKTIEEPPPNVIFILATTEEHKVPATIVSRCQRLMFHLVSQQELCKHLRNVAQQENIEIEDTAIELVARRSGGGLRDALGLLDQASLMGSAGKPVSVHDLLSLLGAVHEDKLLEISAGIRDRNGGGVLQAAHALLMQGREAPVLVLELAKHFLNLTKACYIKTTGNLDAEGLSNLILGSAGYINGLIEQAKDFDRSELAMMVEYLDKLEQTCRRSTQPMLNLEMGLLSLCHRHDITLVKDLVKRVAELEQLVQGDAPMPKMAQPPRPASQPAGAARPPAANYSQAAPTAPRPPVSSPTAPTSAPAASVPPAAPAPVHPVVQAAQAHAAAAATAQGATQSAQAPPAAATAASQVQPQSAIAQLEPAAAQRGAPAEIDDVEDTEPEAWPQDDHDDESLASTQSSTGAQETASETSAPRAAHSEPTAEQNYAAAQTPQLQPEPAAPPPAQAAMPAPTSPSGNEMVLLEEYWQNMLDALQSRHLPTFSLLAANGFPVSLEGDTFTVGVKNENFQKMLENKSKNDHIKGAFMSTLGRDLFVKVKVINQPPQAKTAAPAARPAPRQSDVPPPDDEEAERYGLTDSAPSDQSPPAALETAESAPGRAAAPRAPKPVASREPQGAPPGASAINEAYKIFEGPGSRLIG
jgi:DNA polymerase-3 subunit gamma/tau